MEISASVTLRTLNFAQFLRSPPAVNGYLQARREPSKKGGSTWVVGAVVDASFLKLVSK